MRSRAEIERMRRHLFEVYERAGSSDSSLDVNSRVVLGSLIDALAWVLGHDGVAHLGPISFGELLQLLDAAEGNTPN